MRSSSTARPLDPRQLEFFSCNLTRKGDHCHAVPSVKRNSIFPFGFSLGRRHRHRPFAEVSVSVQTQRWIGRVDATSYEGVDDSQTLYDQQSTEFFDVHEQCNIKVERLYQARLTFAKSNVSKRQTPATSTKCKTFHAANISLRSIAKWKEIERGRGRGSAWYL